MNSEKDNNGQIEIGRELGSIPNSDGHIIPEEVPRVTLLFKVEQREDTLRLISKEWPYKRRSYVTEKLSISIPQGMRYGIKYMGADEFEGTKTD